MHADDQPGDPEAILEAPEGEGAHILFVVVPEGKRDESRTGGRVHLDIMPTDWTRDDEEAERLLGLARSSTSTTASPTASAG